MLLLDGRVVSAKITTELKRRVAKLKTPPRLVIVQVGDNAVSAKYVAAKLKKAAEIGIVAEHVIFSLAITTAKLISELKQIQVHATGVIVQLPLPAHIKKQVVLDSIAFAKDVDGLARHNPLLVPATPKGILQLLSHYRISLRNKQVAVVGQSRLVGKPVADLCELAGASVLRLNKTTGLSGTEKADILIVAAGAPHLIKAQHVKASAVVVDVGINAIADKNAMQRIVGDVDRDSVEGKVSALSPVPGGVGPMTVIALMENVVFAAEHFDH